MEGGRLGRGEAWLLAEEEDEGDALERGSEISEVEEGLSQCHDGDVVNKCEGSQKTEGLSS